MATIDITCEKCSNTSKVPDNLVGKKIRCKKCQNVIAVKAPAKGADAKSGAKPSDGKKPHDDVDRVPYGMQEVNLAARCPHCAQPMDPPDAQICLHCGYHMRKRELVKTKETYEITGVDYLLWHLPTLGCFFGIWFLVGVCVFAGINMGDWVSGSGVDGIVPPGCFTTWLIVMCAYPIWFQIRFVFRRLVWQFTPPEKEKEKKVE